IKFLLFADDLVLLSPLAEGLQQNLKLIHMFWQTWVLTIKSQKEKNTNFSEKSRGQGKKLTIHTHTNTHTHTHHTAHSNPNNKHQTNIMTISISNKHQDHIVSHTHT